MNNIRISLFSLVVLLSFTGVFGQLETPFEKSGGLQSATYNEAIAFYRSLSDYSNKVTVTEFGMTDIGEPLHLVILSNEKMESVEADYLQNRGKLFMLVNNGIHAGESCGVDASMLFARDLATKPENAKFLENNVVLIIPFYNVGGALNRGCCSRTNQVGPQEHGFRGNGRNLDLNRDFIKCDSRNAQSFNQLIAKWRPHLFFDTHTTNGADYPAVMTLIPTQKNKATAPIAKYMEEEMTPDLYRAMQEKDILMCPYVNSVAQVPDSGISDFLETPRYSTGYVNLFNVPGYTSEAHMLKTFKDRVEATHTILWGGLKSMQGNREKILQYRAQADLQVLNQKTFTIRWKLNKEVSEKLNFKGYAAKYKPSKVTGLDRLYYDRKSPWEKEIPYYNQYDAEVTIQKPVAYIIPQAWKEVIDRLEWNGVKMKRLAGPVTLEVESYDIEKYEDVRGPWEGHYAHYNTEVYKTTQVLDFRRGDYVVFTDQIANRYIVETLEPQAHDSYFNWNFFDEILGRKEYFSPYVFEDEAEKLLKKDPDLKAAFETAKQDSAFASSQWAMLDFIYQRSNHFEETYRRYPVVRLMKNTKLNLAVDRN